MNESVSFLTQSNFYSPAFNAAIFDGPIRIYFAQYQEAMALRIYFRMQDELKDGYKEIKDLHRSRGRHLFLMIYPSLETLELSFPHSNGRNICHGRLGDDEVIGICGLLPDDKFHQIYEEIGETIDLWRETPEVRSEMSL
ncbi:MAG: hypothetical protein KDD35_06000 [Bdellovibrionales bacterium]|nr:hypothetical protein [Bdellovibrionales bacterium]